MDPVAELVAGWRDDADALERHGRDGQAARLRAYAEEVEDALRRRRSELVTIEEAARISGYSAEHLRRLVREDKLEADQPGGKGGRILVARGALPRKASGNGSEDSPVDRHLSRLGAGRGS